MTKTRWGYFLYLSALAIVYDTKTQETGLFWLFCCCHVLSTTLILLFLVKVPRTHQFLRNLFGENYLVKHLGTQMMTREAGKIFAGLASVVLAEKAVEHWDRLNNARLADVLEPRQEKLWEKNGYNPSMSEQQQILDKANDIRLKTPNGISDNFFGLVKKIWGNR